MMKRPRFLPPLGALGVIAALAPPALGAPQGQSTPAPMTDADRARELFLRGKKDYADRKFGEAYKSFKAAWELSKSFDVAGNLASVEMQLALYRDAAEHVAYALAHFPPGGPDAARAALQDLRDKARREVGSVTVRVNVDHAAVTVDGKPAGEAPLETEVFCDPGPHTISASAPGYEPATEPVTATKGGTHLVMLTLRKVGDTRPVKPVPTGPRPIAVAGFAVAGVAAGAGAAFAILSKIKGSDADSKYEEIGKLNPPTCHGGANATQCKALHDALASHDAFANASLWTFVGAVAVAGGTLAYTFLVPPDAGAARPAQSGLVRVSPLAGPGLGGLLVTGSF